VHIADTGPVAFQTTSVLVVCYLLRRWILSRSRLQRAWMMSAAGLLIALACWVKPTYFFVSAGLAITAVLGFLLAVSRRNGDPALRTGEYLLLLCCAAVPAILVYQATGRDGSAYLPVLNTQFVPSQVVLAGLGQRFRENVLHFLVNPLDATSFYFDARPGLPVLGIVTCLLGGGLVLSGVFLRRIHRRHRAEMLLNCALFVLALLLVATNIYAKSMHHAVLAYPFVLLAAARAIQLQRRRILVKAALALFIILNGSLFFRFPSMLAESRREGNCKPYVAQLNDDLNRNSASDSVIVCVDWGIYFVKALYGPGSQVVLSLCSPAGDDQLQRAAAIALRLHRNLTVVGLQGNQAVKDRLRAGFPGLGERAGPGEGSPWRIWQVPYQDLPALIAPPSARNARTAPQDPPGETAPPTPPKTPGGDRD
jgi:hypothetical protein